MPMWHHSDMRSSTVFNSYLACSNILPTEKLNISEAHSVSPATQFLPQRLHQPGFHTWKFCSDGLQHIPHARAQRRIKARNHIVSRQTVCCRGANSKENG